MATQEDALRCVLKSRFGISTCKDPLATTQEDDLFKPERQPKLHYRKHGAAVSPKHDFDLKGAPCAWSTVCLYSKVQKGISLCSDVVFGTEHETELGVESKEKVHKKKARKYRASELVLKLCEVCRYDGGDGFLWHHEEGKRASRKRVCGDAACVNPYHRDLNPDTQKSVRFVHHIELHGLRCAAMGVIDQGVLQDNQIAMLAGEPGGTAAVSSIPSPSLSLPNDNMTKRQKVDNAHTGLHKKGDESVYDNSEDCNAPIDLYNDATVSCNHPTFVGWIENVKVWLSDEHIDAHTVCIILDFMIRPASMCHHRYYIKDIKGENVHIGVNQTKPQNGTCTDQCQQHRIPTVPSSMTVNVSVDVKYHRYGDMGPTGDYCGGSAKCIDAVATICEFGGREPLLNKLRKQCLDVQTTKARIMAPFMPEP